MTDIHILGYFVVEVDVFLLGKDEAGWVYLSEADEDSQPVEWHPLCNEDSDDV